MQQLGHTVVLCHDKSELVQGDVLFLVSCAQLLTEADRAKFRKTLVLHASDLPDGRGWSPHIWTILRGGDSITVTLLEAAARVDTGAIWFKERFRLEGHELLPEINEQLFAAELRLMTRALTDFDAVQPTAQVGPAAPPLRKRTPEDSRLDVTRPIADQFNLLRVVDNQRFPAFLDFRGHRYKLIIEKADDDSN